MEIIKLQKNDIKNAINLVWTVSQEFEAPDYSKQGIEEFIDKANLLLKRSILYAYCFGLAVYVDFL
ncbi:hypothetical protein [Clostridium estertheticum]|uniref:hypothetical protein n=1 Tax=Clostridium estertheticum TaxID=238834 RepID=UPI001C7D9C3A|nr:hypothetical protein [Clostridium estertheticum]MBX4271806.1 hypothetical protein [Clostridium estertheticum]WLC82288.1 hypothetical protein KTC98_22715 [Clostridium estertheticum]